jgi:hypothetical protein
MLRPQARLAIRGSGPSQQPVRKTAAGHLTFAALRASAGCGTARAGCRRLLYRNISRRRKSHACSRLLPRPPGPLLDRDHVRPRSSSGSESGRRRVPGQPASRRGGRPARDTRRNHFPGVNGRGRQRLGGLGSQMVHPAPPARSAFLSTMNGQLSADRRADSDGAQTGDGPVSAGRRHSRSVLGRARRPVSHRGRSRDRWRPLDGTQTAVTDRERPI